MGLFSTTKKTYVSTVTYPLGEDDQEERVDFLKYTVLNSVLQEQPIGESITNGYLGGQGLKLRRAYSYARDKYTYGLPNSGFLFNDRPDNEALHAVVSAQHPGKEVYFLQVVVGLADFTWWAERFLAQTYGWNRETKLFSYPPRDVDADASVTYDINRGNEIEILLMSAGGATKTVIFRPQDLTTRVTYVHSVYRTIAAMPVETSTTTRPFEAGDANDVDVAISTVDRNQELHESHVTTTTTTDGVTTTITVKTAVRVMSRPQYFMYRLGAGTHPTLDAMQQSETSASPYFPSIPVRIDNKSMPELVGGAARWEDHPLNETATALLKKVGVDYQDIQDKVHENPQKSEIDFAFIQFGVSLNTKSPEGKKYLYRFFDHMFEQQLHTKAEFDAWAGTQTEVCLPYDRQAPSEAYATLLDPLVRVDPANADVNLCEQIL